MCVWVWGFFLMSIDIFSQGMYRFVKSVKMPSLWPLLSSFHSVVWLIFAYFALSFLDLIGILEDFSSRAWSGDFSCWSRDQLCYLASRFLLHELCTISLRLFGWLFEYGSGDLQWLKEKQALGTEDFEMRLLNNLSLGIKTQAKGKIAQERSKCTRTEKMSLMTLKKIWLHIWRLSWLNNCLYNLVYNPGQHDWASHKA